jgi:hypothetical protein
MERLAMYCYTRQMWFGGDANHRVKSHSQFSISLVYLDLCIMLIKELIVCDREILIGMDADPALVFE